MERRGFLGSLLGLAAIPFVGLPVGPGLPALPLGEIAGDGQGSSLAACISNRKLAKMVIRHYCVERDDPAAELVTMYRKMRWAIKQPGSAWRKMVKNGWVPSPDLETTLRACWAEDVVYLQKCLETSGSI